MTQAATERLPLRRRLEQERGRVRAVGHRGAMGHCPETTLASFELGTNQPDVPRDVLAREHAR